MSVSEEVQARGNKMNLRIVRGGLEMRLVVETSTGPILYMGKQKLSYDDKSILNFHTRYSYLEEQSTAYQRASYDIERLVGIAKRDYERVEEMQSNLDDAITHIPPKLLPFYLKVYRIIGTLCSLWEEGRTLKGRMKEELNEAKDEMFVYNVFKKVIDENHQNFCKTRTRFSSTITSPLLTRIITHTLQLGRTLGELHHLAEKRKEALRGMYTVCYDKEIA